MALWKFSESSQPLLKRCLEASSTIDPDNIWVQKFGHLLQKRNLGKNENESERKEIKTPSPTKVDSKATVIVEKEDVPEELFQDIVESDPVSRFDFIVENCLNDSNLYKKLAKQLPVISIEKLCNHIFQTENVQSKFLKDFYKIFLPEFLKREHSISSIDMLLKAKKYKSEYFNYFLELLIKDTDLPSQVFQQYITIIDKHNQIELMKNIVLYDLSNDVFIHHLHSIYLLYKNCPKTEHLQKHIFLKLSNASQQCASDTNYGRLLLNFIQNQKNFTSNFAAIEKVINKHRSPFKKPCLNAFNDLKELQE